MGSAWSEVTTQCESTQRAGLCPHSRVMDIADIFAIGSPLGVGTRAGMIVIGQRDKPVTTQVVGN